jgi:hypothetical protein
MMNHAKLQETIAGLAQEIDAISDEKIKSIQKKLLNVIELLFSENEKLRKENQQLRDENNRLKGEQGKPSIRKQSQSNHSSEKDRKPRGQKLDNKKAKKKKKPVIDRMEFCDIDSDLLPEDARFKGYQSVTVQNIIIRTETICFKKKVYYSRSLKKTFVAQLPPGYENRYSPSVKALIIDFHQTHKMTESAILAFCTNHGLDISSATISRIIINKSTEFQIEKEAIVDAGLLSSTYQQMDDTGARVKGKNHVTHILCNAFYTAFFTRRHKDRLTLLSILTRDKLQFVFNESAYALMEQMGLSAKQLRCLKMQVTHQVMNRQGTDALLQKLFPTEHRQCSNRQTILEASAITAYQQLPHAIEILLVDDAPQFRQITKYLALCWVHDGRHYKKLRPVVYAHQQLLENFITRYWNYYHELLDYKINPTRAQAEALEKSFESLFLTITGYEALDERILKTKLKKESLLLVLKHPALPLHNNASELGARAQARYRDISFHTMSEAGTVAKDAYMTIVETAKKLTVNTYHYFYDRISQTYAMPSLASLIEEKSRGLAIIG